MTAPARITQKDVDRATKAVAKARLGNARIIMDLERCRIEIIIGESAMSAEPERNPFDED
ncbi:MAG: hypothetical protein VYD90_10850 [Pseudomonadota bacterium]|nr:hypothetical protein [Pseudomonadota bacterium]